MKTQFKTILLLVGVLFLCTAVQAQDTTDQKLRFFVGIEVQAYPTGAIPGIFFEVVKENSNSFHAKFGYNIVRHRDLGVHDLERGGGYGFTIGYKRYFLNEGLKGFYIGARSDVWFNDVSWEDYEKDKNAIIIGVRTKGQSNVVVLQPTAIAGYQLLLGSGRIVFSPQIAFGWEINVKTDGDCSICETNEIGETLSPKIDVGQGAIFLAGFTMAFKIN